MRATDVIAVPKSDDAPTAKPPRPDSKSATTCASAGKSGTHTTHKTESNLFIHTSRDGNRVEEIFCASADELYGWPTSTGYRRFHAKASATSDFFLQITIGVPEFVREANQIFVEGSITFILFIVLISTSGPSIHIS
jgi:hypothetical protein